MRTSLGGRTVDNGDGRDSCLEDVHVTSLKMITEVIQTCIMLYIHTWERGGFSDN